MKIKLNIFITAALLLVSCYAGAQQLNLFLNQEYNAYTDKALNNPSVSIHTGFKPLIESQVNQYISCDSVLGYKFSGPKRSWLYRKLYRESLFIIHDTANKFVCTIDPLFNFQGTDDRGDSSKKFYQNTRGFLIEGSIGSKFSFASSFYENQADYPSYVNQFVQAYGVVPGEGRIKKFGKSGYDFSMSEAYISYSPSKHFNLQLGTGKNFIGDGYRSLLLSDNSFDYPYIRATTTFGHFQYTNLYTIFMNTNEAVLSNGTEGLLQRKAASFQYLSWNICSRLEWGIFQGMIWQASDSNNKQSYNFYYFNPVIGVSAAKYGLANTNNVLLGSTLKYKICTNMMAYGQLVIDDLGSPTSVYDKTGYQFGLKYYNHLGEAMVEYNQVRPYTYSAYDPAQSYSHYNQALADPLGANFREIIGMVNCRFAKHFSAHIQANYMVTGLPTKGLIYSGSNIFVQDNYGLTNTNVSMLQGIKATVTYADAHISYLMNPRTNMNITLGLTQRIFKSDAPYSSPTASLIYIGFRTSITNNYFDF